MNFIRFFWPKKYKKETHMKYGFGKWRFSEYSFLLRKCTFRVYFWWRPHFNVVKNGGQFLNFGHFIILFLLKKRIQKLGHNAIVYPCLALFTLPAGWPPFLTWKSKQRVSKPERNKLLRRKDFLTVLAHDTDFSTLQNCDSYEARLKMLGRSTSGEEDSSKRRHLSPDDDQYR